MLKAGSIYLLFHWLVPASIPPDLVAVSYYGQFAHLDAHGGLTGPVHTGLPSSLQALAVSPVDGQLYAAAESGIYILDPATGATTLEFPLGLNVRGMAISPDGIMYITETSSNNPGITRFHTVDLAEGHVTPLGQVNGGVQGLDFGPDGVLYGISPYQFLVDTYELLRFDDLSYGIVRSSIGHFAEASVGQSLVFAEDGSLFALGEEFARLDPFTGAVIGEVRELDDDYRGVAIIPEPNSLMLWSPFLLALLIRAGLMTTNRPQAKWKPAP